MALIISLLSLLSTASALSIQQQNPNPIPPRQHILSNPPSHDESYYHIPTVHESAIMARRILRLSTIGTLVTSFPDEHSTIAADDDHHANPPAALENRPQGVENNPIGLMEYYADCEPDTGNPTLLAINIATPFKNYIAGSNISLSVRWWPKASNIYSTAFASSSDDEDIPTPHTPAALPRFSLHGHLEHIGPTDLARHLIPACFLKTHPDSVLWQPGNDISHESEYMRFVVEYVYWFGGFGDRARIGWLPVEEWRGVSGKEIEGCRLPGEERKEEKGGWKEGL